jgi:hypothetical protein
MTFTEAAEVVLRQVGKPLHFKKITQLVIEQNLLSHVGKTPEITMSTRLTTLTKKDKGDAPIVRVKPGVFALRVWGEAAVAAAADVEESEEPVLPEGAEAEEEPVEAPVPPTAEEREREDLLEIAQTIFAAEDDDDLPVLADPPPKAPPPAAAGAAADAEGAGRRRRRRRRRRGGERTDLASDPNAPAAEGEELEGDDEESDAEPELRADAGDGDDRGEPAFNEDGTPREDAPVAEGEERAPRAEGAPAPSETPREPRRERGRDRGRDRGDRGGDRPERAAADRADRGGERGADRGDRGADRSGDRPERAAADRADRGGDRPERGAADRDRGDRDRSDRDRERGDRDRDRGERDRGERAERAPTEDTFVEAGRDAAELVVSLLQRRDDRGPVPFRALVDDAIRSSRLAGDPNVLAASLAASARADSARRESRGERARLRVQGSRVTLVEWTLGGELLRAEEDALVALERVRDAARRQLVRKLNELPQSAFVELLALTLERVGLSNLRSIRRAGASQGELYVTATARVAGEEIPAAILLKRGGEIGRERVIELRGSMHHFNHARAAWIVTTGTVLSGAREEAGSADAAPVTLVDGQALSRWMDEHGVGVKHARVSLPYIDLDLFDALRG